MGRHDGDVEDGGCQTPKIDQVATGAGAKPAAGKGQGACATTMRMDRIQAAARSAWKV